MKTMEKKSNDIDNYITNNQDIIYRSSNLGINVRNIMRYAQNKGCKISDLTEEESNIKPIAKRLTSNYSLTN